jgi:hypothetical protein
MCDCSSVEMDFVMSVLCLDCRLWGDFVCMFKPVYPDTICWHAASTCIFCGI